MTTKIAIVQQNPVYFDLSKSIQKALTIIKHASENKAKIVVFGETWLTGYPSWIDYCPEVAIWDNSAVKNAWATLFENSIDMHDNEIKLLQNAARENKVYLIIGVNEAIKKGKGNGSIYNSILTIDAKGNLINHHRKLMPTFSEKLVYGLGDGHGLNSFNTDYGNIGSLICWEHWMPLARQAMHDEGEDIHFALWPSVHEIHQIASRQYAFEGKCIVVAVGQIMEPNSIPSSLKLPDNHNNKKLLLNGGSCVIGPNGQFLLEPQFDINDTIYVDIPSPKDLVKERMNLSTSGHYQRNDVFSFQVNKKRLTD